MSEKFSPQNPEAQHPQEITGNQAFDAISRLETEMSVPALDSEARGSELAHESFFSQRYEGLKKAYHGAKKLWGALNNTVRVSVDGEQSTIKQGLKARLLMISQVPHMLVESRYDTSEGQTLNRYKEQIRDSIRQERQVMASRRDWEAEKPNNLDLAKYAAYELMSVAPLRMMGAMAIEFATRVKPESKVHTWAVARNDLYEEDMHNPTVRKLGGYTRKQAYEHARNARRKDVKPRKSEFLD